MDHLYAALGRKQDALDNLNDEYNRLLAVLGQVASGEIAPTRVSVDLAARSWAVAPLVEEHADALH